MAETETQRAAEGAPVGADGETIAIKHRWTVLAKPKRRGTPKSRMEVRAKVSHTAHETRRVEIFVPSPVIEKLGWKEGAFVEPQLGDAGNPWPLRVIPSHRGLRLCRANKDSPTIRLSLYGDFIKQRICAAVRPVPFECDGAALLIGLPTEWLRGWSVGQ